MHHAQHTPSVSKKIREIRGKVFPASVVFQLHPGTDGLGEQDSSKCSASGGGKPSVVREHLKLERAGDQMNVFEDRSDGCKFCQIVRGEVRSHIVFEDDATFVFLDHRPLFAGHCLLIPKEHYETLRDLPAAVVPVLFSNVQLVAGAVEEALAADGSFVAINNRVSQSVPHLHVHVVPRRKKDGLKGFFWPRQKYENEEAILKVQGALRSTIARIKAAPA